MSSLQTRDAAAVPPEEEDREVARKKKDTPHPKRRHETKLQKELRLNEKPNTKQRIQKLLDDPTSSTSARALMIGMTTLVLFSVLVLITSTMPELKDSFISNIHVDNAFSVRALTIVLMCALDRLRVIPPTPILSIAYASHPCPSVAA